MFYDQLNTSYIYHKNVTDILSSRNITDYLQYLEFQGYTYIQRDFKAVTEEELSTLFTSKSNFFEERQKYMPLYNFTLANGTTSAARHMESQNAPGVSFKAIDKQYDHAGAVNVGSDSSWCSSSRIMHARLSSKSTSDLLCVQNGTLSSSSFFNYGFGESWNLNVSTAPKLDIFKNLEFQLPRTIFFGDFDGDGKDEIGAFLINSTFNGFYIYSVAAPEATPIYYNTSTVAANLVKSNFNSNPAEHGIVVGDYNGDGKDDILFHAWNGTNYLFSNNNYLTGDFTTSQIVPGWCKEGFIRAADFNGDGKDDLLCIKTPADLYLMYSIGDNMFIGASGTAYGELNTLKIASKLAHWADKSSDYNKIKIGDYDGDGLADIWHNQVGFNFILFGSKEHLFESRSPEHSSGHIQMNSLPHWCLSGTISSADINGDGKDDVFCHENGHLLTLLSGNSPQTATYPANIHIRYNTFKLSPLFLKSAQIKTITQTKICDNKARPDDKLECKVSSSLTSRESQTKSQITYQSIENQAQTTFSGLFSAPLSIHDATTPSNTDPYPTTGTHISSGIVNINVQKDGTITTQTSSDEQTVGSSTSIIVKSGECVKISTLVKYAHSIEVPYDASIVVTAKTSDGTSIIGRALIDIVKKQIAGNITETFEQNDSVQATVSGVIKANLAVDSYSLAENCDF